MSEDIARNMYSSQGIINYPKQLHLVGHFRILCSETSAYKIQTPGYYPENITQQVKIALICQGLPTNSDFKT